MSFFLEGSLTTVLREVWKRDRFLMTEIPALDDDLTQENRFFDDGTPQWISEDAFPPKCVIVDDFGDEIRTRASNSLEERSAGVRVRIISPTFALTEKLVEIYLELIEQHVTDYVCHQGSVGDYLLSSQRFGRTNSGLRLWQGQFEFTLHRSRTWHLPTVVVSHV